VFASYTDILDAPRRLAKTSRRNRAHQRITSIAVRDWAIIGQLF
jgi:hypothetical protein